MCTLVHTVRLKNILLKFSVHSECRQSTLFHFFFDLCTTKQYLISLLSPFFICLSGSAVSLRIPFSPFSPVRSKGGWGGGNLVSLSKHWLTNSSQPLPPFRKNGKCTNAALKLPYKNLHVHSTSADYIHSNASQCHSVTRAGTHPYILWIHLSKRYLPHVHVSVGRDAHVQLHGLRGSAIPDV